MKKQSCQATDQSVALSVGQFANARDHSQLNLVPCTSGIVPVSDLHQVNPWVISRTSGSSSWISDNGTGLGTFYNSTGAIPRTALSVRIGTGN
ncbi:MAG TPA: hypothetical protein VI320_04735 [Terracidiphilus sp.]